LLFRALIYDVLRKYNYQMKIALKWTINNFPVYEMVSRWSTHEKLASSYCMENNKTFTLTNGVKTSFFIATEGSCQVIIDTKRKKKTS